MRVSHNTHVTWTSSLEAFYQMKSAVYFLNKAFDAYFAPVLVESYSKPCYVGPCYNSTRLYNAGHFFRKFRYIALIFFLSHICTFSFFKNCHLLISLVSLNACKFIAPFASVRYDCITRELRCLACYDQGKCCSVLMLLVQYIWSILSSDMSRTRFNKMLIQLFF